MVAKRAAGNQLVPRDTGLLSAVPTVSRRTTGVPMVYKLKADSTVASKEVLGDMSAAH